MNGEATIEHFRRVFCRAALIVGPCFLVIALVFLDALVCFLHRSVARGVRLRSIEEGSNAARIIAMPCCFSVAGWTTSGNRFCATLAAQSLVWLGRTACQTRTNALLDPLLWRVAAALRRTVLTVP